MVKRILAIDPGIGTSKTLGVAVTDGMKPVYLDILDGAMPYHQISAALLELAERFQVEDVVCEDFVFFFGSKNGAVLTKMNRMLGVLDGRFFASGRDITFYTSSVWKKGLKHGDSRGTDAAKLYLHEYQIQTSDKKSLSHCIDAYGLSAYHHLRSTNDPRIISSKKSAKTKDLRALPNEPEPL